MYASTHTHTHVYLKAPLCGLRLFLRSFWLKNNIHLHFSLSLARHCWLLLISRSLRLSMGRQMHTHSCRIYYVTGVIYKRNRHHTQVKMKMSRCQNSNNNIHMMVAATMVGAAMVVMVFNLFLEKQSTKNQEKRLNKQKNTNFSLAIQILLYMFRWKCVKVYT